MKEKSEAKVTISFLGAAGQVTGSKHLLSVDGTRVLIDCGLFQGLKEDRQRNWEPFQVDPREIDAVILTHAHLDHCGYLPVLVKNGFRGPIYCSEPTAELAKVVLEDSASIEEEEADHANQHGYSKHRPALPLYTVADAERVFEKFEVLDVGHWVKIADDRMKIRLSSSGHILGSTFVEIRVLNKLIVFSGDIGREHPICMRPREILEEADALILESTYGDRCHPKENPKESLFRIINQTLLRGGHLIIPAFAIGRTQDILHLIALLKSEGRIPSVPIYLDSPMADLSNSVFDRFPDWHKLTSPDLKRLSATCHRVSSYRQSRFLCKNREPSIVIAGSGMLTGGRVLRHLVARLPDKRCTIALVGFQAAGTLGRFLREGANEVKIHGEYIPVVAQIADISSLSAHADQHEILSWMAGFKRQPEQIFIVHGEPHSAEGLRVRIQDRFHLSAHIAKIGETVEVP